VSGGVEPADPVAVLSSVAVSGAHGSDSLAALTNGYQSAFAAAIVFAVLGLAVASLLLGKSRGPEAVTEPDAEPAVA